MRGRGKKMRKTIFLVGSACLLLVGCTASEQKMTEESVTTTVENISKFTMSNMADTNSQEEVNKALVQYLDAQDVNTFMSFVKDYNETIEHISLATGFQKEMPIYDQEKIDTLWAQKKNTFPGTNCRINTFALLKKQLSFSDNIKEDSQLLFIDNDSIDMENLFTTEEKAYFNQLFSRVQTTPSKDVHVHAKKMEEHLSHVQFTQNNATMLSVVFHDNLDGDYLFIGHVGVLVPHDNGYLFVEKLSFQEPYQALKFKEKTDVYDYLMKKYNTSYDQDTAPAFLMENQTFINYQ
ncbi:DUF4300 family protein [Granulicatella sp. zg-84]|nr:DUF4300 family protein [Granulicatella sp. zg-84]